MYLASEHFVTAPNWRWYILGYFLLAGLSAGSYLLGSLLRLFGQSTDTGTARAAFLLAFPLLLVCPVLLILDLGQPVRFWHMMFNPVDGTINLKPWSPMSLGVWGLGLYTTFAFVNFVEVLVADGRLRIGALAWLPRLLQSRIGSVFQVAGSLAALFIGIYTGVLISVSNQPVWSDTWTIGALFLLSGLTGGGALVMLIARRRPDFSPATEALLERVETYFVVLEILFIGLFLGTLAAAGSLGIVFSGLWPLLWLVVAVALVLPLLAQRRFRGWSVLVAPLVSLLGVISLRVLVIFPPQG